MFIISRGQVTLINVKENIWIIPKYGMYMQLGAFYNLSAITEKKIQYYQKTFVVSDFFYN